MAFEESTVKSVKVALFEQAGQQLGVELLAKLVLHVHPHQGLGLTAVEIASETWQAHSELKKT